MKNIEIYYSLKVHGASGLLIYDSGVRAAHSFTLGFSKLLFNVVLDLSRFSPTSITSTSGSSLTVDTDMGIFTSAPSGTSVYGIQVGTGTGAEAITNTALGTQIAHGTSAGTLQYGEVSYGAPSTTATTTTFRTTRVFTNGSGGTVTVQEIGLVSVVNSGDTTDRILLIRDLTGAVAVNNGQQLTVNYDLTTTI